MRHLTLGAQPARSAVQVLLDSLRRLVVVCLLSREGRVAPPADQHLSAHQLAPIAVPEVRVDRHVDNPSRLGRGGEHLRARRLDLHRRHQLRRVRVRGQDDDARLTLIVAGRQQDAIAA